MSLEEALNDLTPEELTALHYDWEFWARPDQLEPKDWRIWLILTGRGWGKTRTGAETVRRYARSGKVGRIALVAATAADYRDTLIEGDSGILATASPDFKPEWVPSRRLVKWPNGCIGICYSADAPERLRGPQHGLAWCDELAAWKYPKKTWDNLMFGLRMQPGRTIITTTPRPIPLIVKLSNDPVVTKTSGTTYENLGNLSEAYKKEIITPYEGTRIGRQELHGDLLLDTPGALWNHDILEAGRVTEAAAAVQSLKRVVVAIDPSVTYTESSHETGIVVVGSGPCGCKGTSEKHGFVLDDRSLKAKPATWAKVAVNLFDYYKADRIVGEVNNGGDLVEEVLKTDNPNIPYTSVRASRGKVVRAEPIAALYEQGKVHHVGVLGKLEDQMCLFTHENMADEESISIGDDRVDALVWGLSEVMLGGSGYWPYAIDVTPDEESMPTRAEALREKAKKATELRRPKRGSPVLSGILGKRF